MMNLTPSVPVPVPNKTKRWLKINTKLENEHECESGSTALLNCMLKKLGRGERRRNNGCVEWLPLLISVC